MYFHFSSRFYSLLFRIFLVIFIFLYFIPVGINIHKIQIIKIPADYICHSVLCFVLFFLYTGSLDTEADITDVPAFVLKILVLVLIILLFEYINLLVPSRSFDMKDLLSNATGILTGTMTKLIFSSFLQTRTRSVGSGRDRSYKS